MYNSEEFSQRIEDCRELYLKYGGKRHELIEKEMRDLGYRDFHRRSMYRRFERGTCRPGWIETYGWDYLLKFYKEKAEREALLSPKGTKIIAQGKAEGRNPGYGDPYNSDPEGVEQPTLDVAPLQGADAVDAYPGVTIAQLTHPRLLSLSPSATGTPQSNDFDEFKEWLKKVSPEKQWDFKHQVYIYKRLEKVTKGECKRLMVFMPPRHGKSEMVTVRYSAWRLKNDPSMNVILASYNQQLANRFSRKIKGVLCDDHELRRGEEEKGRRGEEEKRGTGETDRVEPNQDSRRSKISPSPLPLFSSSPFPFVRTRPKNTEAEWETTMGGGLRAVGVGSGVTGFGANLIIIDDPIKSRAEAESPKMRERVWNWFNDDIRTRLEPDGSIILIQTRWHEDDLAGRLLREAQEEGGEQWTVVNLPALSEPGAIATGFAEIENRELKMENENAFLSPAGTQIIAQGKAKGRNPGYATKHESDPEGVEQTTLDVAPLQGVETHDPHPGVTLAPLTHPRLLSLSPSATGTGDPLNRLAGEALWPERFDEQYFDKQKRQIGSYAFASLYQQRPTPAEGALFKRDWFKIINQPPPNLKWTRGYDLGISKNATADYTASMRIAFDADNNMYIDGGYRARIEYPEQRRYILGRINSERDTIHGIELSANGNAVIQDLRKSKLTLGRALRGLKAQGDKVTHALPWIALAEEGRVFLTRAPWNKDFLEEAAAFPLGTHDDQIDAVSLALRLHRERGYKFVTC